MQMKHRPHTKNGSRLPLKQRGFPAKLAKQAAFICLLAWPRLAVAVLFYSTADPAHNTTAPTGVLTNSGWQYQGLWGAYLGTPIAPKYFITAAHVGGSVGDRFRFRG